MKVTYFSGKLCFLLLLVSVAVADETASPDIRQSATEADLLAISNLLVGEYPELSSSPGVKASLFRPDNPGDRCGRWLEKRVTEDGERLIEMKSVNPNCGFDTVTVAFFPHSERAGRREALLAFCRKPSEARTPVAAESLLWSCPRVLTREFVQLAGQVCEVRLTGDMSILALEAVRQAGFDMLRNLGEEQPEALILFTRFDETTWHASFGANDCRSTVALDYSLIDGGDRTIAAHWQMSQLLCAREPELCSQ